MVVVEIVDLLGDSTDDESDGGKVQQVKHQRLPASGLPVAVTQPVGEEEDKKKNKNKNKNKNKPPARAEAGSSDNEGDVVETVCVLHSRALTRDLRTNGPSAIEVAASARKPPPAKSGDSTDDDDEVVIVDPPAYPKLSEKSRLIHGCANSSVRSPPKWSVLDGNALLMANDPPCKILRGPPLVNNRQLFSNATPNDSATRRTGSSRKRPSVLDSDVDDSDDDDEFLLRAKPSGLGPPLSREVASPVIEPWRRQFVTTTGTNSAGGKTKKRTSLQTGSAADDCDDSRTDTATIATSASAASIPQTSRSRSGSHSALHNPYGKTKTPPTKAPARASHHSTGDRSRSSSSPLSIEFRSPHTVNNRRVVVANPYSKGSSSSSICSSSSSSSVRTAGKKRRRNSPAPVEATATAVIPSASSLSGVCAPTISYTTKRYTDVRPNILLALWKFARTHLVRDSYEGKRLDRFVGRIVDLAVTAPDFPIRSIGEYAVRKRGHTGSKWGCGVLSIAGSSASDSIRRFEEQLASTGAMGGTELLPMAGRYFSIAEACLVAVKETIEARWNRNRSPSRDSTARLWSGFPVDKAGQEALFAQKDYYVSLEELIPEVDKRLRPECPSRLERGGEADRGASYYLDRSTRSAEFRQIEKLLAPVDTPMPDGSVDTSSYLKKRMRCGRQHYQLTPLGFRKAVIVSGRTLPAPAGHYRTSNLRKVPPKYDRIFLAVDFREGGGGDRHRKILHDMCNKLDLQEIPYLVNTLRIGDYCFFSGDKLCPILVERKSVEDVAKSIDDNDGRWIRQKRRMYQGQYVFGYQNCRIAYIIEGKVEKHLVSNGFVGNARHKVSRKQFEEEVAKLEEEGFEVLRTCSFENSMLELARWAESVAKDVRSGKLPLEFTYKEFVEAVGRIPKEVDFSRLARYHAEERRLRDVQRASTTVDLVSDDDGNSDGCHPKGDHLRPTVLDERLRRTEKRPSLESSTTDALKRYRLGQDVRRDAGMGSHADSGSPASAAACTAGTRRTQSAEATGSAKNEYNKWTVAALRERCVELGLKKTGSKSKLIERLLDPTSRPPPIYRMRQERGLYVPAKIDTASTAILVAIQIKQDGAPVGVEKYAGATKDEIYVLADKIDIKKDPFSGGTTQTGPYRKSVVRIDSGEMGVFPFRLIS